MNDLNNIPENKDNKVMCVSCCGTGTVYFGEEDTECTCTYCNGSGNTTEAENECYLDTLNYN